MSGGGFTSGRATLLSCDESLRLAAVVPGSSPARSRCMIWDFLDGEQPSHVGANHGSLGGNMDLDCLFRREALGVGDTLLDPCVEVGVGREPFV